MKVKVKSTKKYTVEAKIKEVEERSITELGVEDFVEQLHNSLKTGKSLNAEGIALQRDIYKNIFCLRNPEIFVNDLFNNLFQNFEGEGEGEGILVENKVFLTIKIESPRGFTQYNQIHTLEKNEYLSIGSLKCFKIYVKPTDFTLSKLHLTLCIFAGKLALIDIGSLSGIENCNSNFIIVNHQKEGTPGMYPIGNSIYLKLGGFRVTIISSYSDKPIPKCVNCSNYCTNMAPCGHFHSFLCNNCLKYNIICEGCCNCENECNCLPLNKTDIKCLYPNKYCQEGDLSATVNTIQEGDLSAKVNEIQEACLPAKVNEIQEVCLPAKVNEIQEACLPAKVNEIQEACLPAKVNEIQAGDLSATVNAIQEDDLSATVTAIQAGDLSATVNAIQEAGKSASVNAV